MFEAVLIKHGAAIYLTLVAVAFVAAVAAPWMGH